MELRLCVIVELIYLQVRNTVPSETFFELIPEARKIEFESCE